MVAPPFSPPAGDTPEHGIDTFARKAGKLCALLGLERSARVLLIGAGEPDWRADLASSFESLFHARTTLELDALLDGRRYDLIVWTPGLDATTIPVWMRRLRQSLTVDGTLFILAENRFGARALRRAPLRIFATERSSLRGYRKQLGRAGFERVHGFLPLPSLPSVEEFVSLEGGDIALPTYTTRLESVLNRAGLLWTIHDGAAYLASGPEGGEQSLLTELGQLLAASGHGDLDSLQLERFDLRDRGALILFLRAGDSRMVCRVAVEETIDRVVSRNDDWTRRIAESPLISATIKAAVPKSLGSFSLKGGNAYLEALTPGTISWKLSGSAKLERRLFRALEEFIAKLGTDTVARTFIDERLASQLLTPYAQEDVDAHVAEEYHALCDALRSRIIGRERSLVWTHGDFGYGNVIADQQTAALRGVIDWDQARQDLAGVDLVNFLVQRERALLGRSLPDALHNIGDALRAGGFRAYDSRLTYDQMLPVGSDERQEIIAWATLRFAQRSMAYPALFVSAREETRAALQMAREALAPRGSTHAAARSSDRGEATATTVLFLHRGANLIRGSEEVLLTLLENLDNTQFRPLVICNTEIFAEAVRALGIRCEVSEFPEVMLDPWEAHLPVASYFRTRDKLMDFCRAENVGLLFSSGGGPCQLAVPLASKLGIPCVCMFHHPAPKRYHFLWHMKKVDTIIFTSRFTAEHTREQIGKTGAVVYAGIDSERFSPADRSKSRLRESLGIGEDEVVFSQLGALIPSKGHDILLDAFDRARKAVPSARLLIIGAGPEKENISARIASMGLGDSVTMTGFVDDVVPYFREVIDVNVLASLEEGMGLVNLQSSSCGLPNIATDCTGIREAVLHGVTGFLFEAGNSSLLAGHMINLAGDRDLRTRMGAAGRQFILDDFATGVYADRIQELMRRSMTRVA